MKSVVIYGPGPNVRLMMGAGVGANAFAAVTEGGEARRLHGSALSDLATCLDGRLPPTIAEFDAAYPGLADWYA